MNAARRKRDPHPLARFVSKFLPFLGGGWPRAFAAVAILGLFIGGAVYAWHRWGGRITPKRRVRRAAGKHRRHATAEVDQDRRQGRGPAGQRIDGPVATRPELDGPGRGSLRRPSLGRTRPTRPQTAGAPAPADRRVGLPPAGGHGGSDAATSSQGSCPWMAVACCCPPRSSRRTKSASISASRHRTRRPRGRWVPAGAILASTARRGSRPCCRTRGSR